MLAIITTVTGSSRRDTQTCKSAIAGWSGMYCEGVRDEDHSETSRSDCVDQTVQVFQEAQKLERVLKEEWVLVRPRMWASTISLALLQI